MKCDERSTWLNAYDELLNVCVAYKAGECDFVSRLIKYKLATCMWEAA